MRANRQERLDGELLEQLVTLRVSSTHEHDHLMGQLERIGLKFDSLERRLSYVETSIQEEIYSLQGVEIQGEKVS